MKISRIQIGIAVLVGVVILGWYLVFDQNDSQTRFAPHVRVATAYTGDVSDVVTLAGEVLPVREVQIASKQFGRIANLGVDVGDVVYAGTVIASVSAESQSVTLENIAAQEQALDTNRAAVDALLQEKERAAAVQAGVFTNAVDAVQVSKQRAVLTEATIAISQANDFLTTLLSVRNGIEYRDSPYFAYLGVRDQQTRIRAIASLASMQSDFPSYKSYFDVHILSTTPTQLEVDTMMSRAVPLLSKTKQALNDTYAMLGATESFTDLPEATLVQYKATVTTLGGAIEKAQQDIQDVTVASAQASIAYSAAQKERAEKNTELDMQQALLDGQRASTQQSLADTYISVPFAGTISKKYTEIGAVVSPGMPIYALIDTAELLVSVPLPDTFLTDTEDIQVHVTDSEGVHIPARVKKIYPTVDATTKKRILELSIDGAKAHVMPGSSVTVSVEKRGASTVVVPASSVVHRYGIEYVYVVEQGVVHMRVVTVGAHTEQEVAIRKGVSDGETVITDGVRYLRDGDSVTIE